MSLSRVATRSRLGLNAVSVQVEVHLSPGLPAIAMVGMPESVLREAKERVRSAVISSGFRWPDSRLTINIAPASTPKSGASFDLAIAIAVLIASGQLSSKLAESAEFYGELSLSGDVLSTSGLLAAAWSNRNSATRLFAPRANAPQMASLAQHVVAVDNLNAFREPHRLDTVKHPQHITTPRPDSKHNLPAGQPELWRAATLCASGGHHLLISGEPGAGKTMTASLIGELLPEPSKQDQLEAALIFDVAGQTFDGHRPLRAPHHTISSAGLVGGTRYATPGEISLAHTGVLFLDEFPEFSLATIENLRQPMESGEVRISRAEITQTYPARFQLIAAMNPCPCGYRDSRSRACRCSSAALARYDAKLSGPLLDRIDLFVNVSRSKVVDIMKQTREHQDQLINLKAVVNAAHERQILRQGCSNARIDAADLIELCSLNRKTRQWLVLTGEKLKLSGRSLHRCLRVGRTIADIDGRTEVTEGDLSEALTYRKDNDLAL